MPLFRNTANGRPAPPVPRPPASGVLARLLPSRQSSLGQAVQDFDEAVDRQLDRLRGNKWSDRVFYTASEVGDFSLIWQLVAVTRGLRRRGDVAGTVRLAAALGLESALVNGPIKSLFRRQRPIPDAPRPHRLRQPRTSSFPSGHASAAAFFFVVASEDDGLWPLYLAAAGTVATSRAYVRIHHGSDVVAGAVVGSVLGVAFRRWWPADRAVPYGLDDSRGSAGSQGTGPRSWSRRQRRQTRRLRVVNES